MRTGGEEESGDSQKIVIETFGGTLQPQPLDESGDSQKQAIGFIVSQLKRNQIEPNLAQCIRCKKNTSHRT